MRRALFAALSLAAASACAGSSAGGATNSTQALCRFSSPPLTTGAQARQMAAEIQAVMPKSSLNDPRNLQINKAILELMVAAGSTVPTGVEGEQDPALAQAVQAQAKLAAACA
jgi:hypothetical protein